MNRWKGRRYQRVLVLRFVVVVVVEFCLFVSPWAIPKRLIFRKENLWFGDLCVQLLGDREKFVVSPDVILCG